MKNLLIAAAVAATVATPAAANEFSGPRIEARIGLDAAHVSWKGHDDEGNYADNANANGLAYGVGIGYDYALNSKVTVGLEANLDFSQLNTNGDVRLPYDGAYMWTELDREFEVAARAGYALNSSTLAYVKAGYVNLGLDGSYDGETASQKIGGYSLGAGLETKLSSRLYVKGEYRFSRYDQWHVEFDDGAWHDDTVMERHKATVAVGLRF